jgi:hypothetical protein
MRYRKMQQTVNAMKTILTEMRDQDYLTIIRFVMSVIYCNVTVLHTAQ